MNDNALPGSPAYGRESSLFFRAGSGAAYTTIHFHDQDAHLLFMLQGGIGFKWQTFFIEDRFRHYSNAGLASPNAQINANIISIGIYF